jgi:hypothetical protein
MSPYKQRKLMIPSKNKLENFKRVFPLLTQQTDQGWYYASYSYKFYIFIILLMRSSAEITETFALLLLLLLLYYYYYYYYYY